MLKPTFRDATPVLSRSRTWRLAMKSRAPSLTARSSSRSSDQPFLTTPPSWRVAGGSSEIALFNSVDTSSKQSLSTAHSRIRESFASIPAAWISGSCSRDLPSPARSRGVTRPVPTLPASRSRSVMPERDPRIRLLTSGRSTNSSTAPCRTQMSSM